MGSSAWRLSALSGGFPTELVIAYSAFSLHRANWLGSLGFPPLLAVAIRLLQWQFFLRFLFRLKYVLAFVGADNPDRYTNSGPLMMHWAACIAFV